MKKAFVSFVICIFFCISFTSLIYADYKTDFYKGKEAFEKKQYSIASHYFNIAQQQKPNSEVIHYYLAITQAYLKKYDDARTNYQWVLNNGKNEQMKKLAGEGLIFLPQKRNAANTLNPVINNNNINKKEYSDLTFKLLSEYKYNWRERNPPPASVKVLENKKLRIKGYMIPVEGGEYFTTFLLVNALPECFFCKPPASNQVLQIELHNGKVNYIKDKLIDVYGILKIGQIDDPFIACIYTIKADFVESK